MQNRCRMIGNGQKTHKGISCIFYVPSSFLVFWLRFGPRSFKLRVFSFLTYNKDNDNMVSFFCIIFQFLFTLTFIVFEAYGNCKNTQKEKKG